MSAEILKVKDLRTYFFTDIGIVKAVDGVDLCIKEKETLGLVGESASGKSVIAYSVMGLIPKPAGRIVSGQVIFKEKSLLGMSDREMREIRGKDIAMIPQDPTTALNPLFTIGNQIGEVIRYHERVGRPEIFEKVKSMLRVARVPSPESCLKSYPHEFSGGLKQRAIIAMALSGRPDLLIADEPTSALDVTIQMQIIKLIRELREQFGTSMLLITHNLGIVAKMCDRVAILYCGRIVEEGTARAIFYRPKHPYTKGLLASLPRGHRTQKGLYTIPGQPPGPLNREEGCHFYQRCEFARDRCSEPPGLEKIEGDDQRVRCWRWRELE